MQKTFHPAIIVILALCLSACQPAVTQPAPVPTGTPIVPPVMMTVPPQPSAPGVPSTSTPAVIQIGAKAFFPTTQLLSKIPDLFPTPSPYRGLTAPGKMTYSVMAQTTQTYYLGFPWCATSQDLLNSTVKSISYQLFIDNQEVSPKDILQYEGPGTHNGRTFYCHYWTTSLADWHKYAIVTIDAVFTYSAPLTDGANSYSPGKYEQVVVVNVH